MQAHSSPLDTIVALSTPVGVGALAMIRVSGSQAIKVCDKLFVGALLTNADSHTVHFGKIINENQEVVDECLVSVFKNPASYTGEDIVELSVHGSSFIIKEVMRLILKSESVRMADPGEFTMRAYLNGQLDLSQAEAVGDLIASTHASSHALAMSQLRGGFSQMIVALRDQMIEFASLLELENDFGEEDVTFADRTQLEQLLNEITGKIKSLADSFRYGNALKDGVGVAIVGAPNVGKSTLLNALLQDDKAIVSDIPGTTRDAIEDSVVYEGIKYRFIDTAGIRETDDHIENLGIERTMKHLSEAHIVIYVDSLDTDESKIIQAYQDLEINKQQSAILVLNKLDAYGHTCHAYDIEESISTKLGRIPVVSLSAKERTHLQILIDHLVKIVTTEREKYTQTMVTNVRHHQCLLTALESLNNCKQNLSSGTSSDFLAMDIRHANHALSSIVGEISTEDLLDSIFSNFCIGK